MRINRKPDIVEMTVYIYISIYIINQFLLSLSLIIFSIFFSGFRIVFFCFGCWFVTSHIEK